jgi:hypothetical protein
MAILGVMGAVCISGCATSSLVDVWKDPRYTAGTMTNMLVVSMNPDAAKRRIWEDAFAQGLRERGVKATTSYQLFPNELPDTNAIIAAVNEHDFDGCLATARLATEYVTQEVPGYVTDNLVTGYNPWSNRYYDYYQQVYTPGYTETQTVMRYRIEVWDTRQAGSLVWTATSEVLDPGPSNGANQAVVDRIIKSLADNRIVPSSK